MATYVKNKDLYNELKRCKDASLSWSPLLHEYSTLMIDKFSNKFSYKNPMDRDDCKQQAIIDIYMYWHNWDPKYPNAFSYISQIIKNAFAKGWRDVNRGKKGTHISYSSGNIHTI